MNSIIALLAIPSALGAVSPFPMDCDYQCSAEDVEVTGAQISDQNGNDLQCRFCEPGNPASAYLALTVYNKAAASRYNIYMIYTLSLNGADQPRTFSCITPSIGGGQTIKVEIPLSWTCGQSVDLKNIILTWSTSPSENTCDIVKNCHPPGQSWCTPLLRVKAPLVAAFTSNSPQCICVPQSCQPIKFTSQATGGSGSYTYLWDFGDGSSSTAQNPAKQYGAPGVYQVTFTVSDGKCSDSHSGQVTVYPAPIASFTSLPAICLGKYLQFTDTSTPGTAVGITPASIVKWEWDFGDGSAHSLDRNPLHHYQSASNYQVTLKVTDSRGCTASVTSSVQVYVNPVPTFTVDSPTLCFRPGLLTQFHGQASEGSGPYSFAWDYGDGSTGTGSDPTHKYTNFGTYNVKITVTDSHGCTGTTTAQITIVDCDPPGIDGVTASSDPICKGLEKVVNAHVVDYVGVTSVTFNYQVNGGAVIQKAMTFVAGSGNITNGQWSVEVPGQAAGSTLTYWITVYDGTFTTQSAHYSISYIDCTPPAVTSVKASTFTPCAGSDVLITAHATAGPGVASVTIDYNGTGHPMSGPAGSISGDWTYSIPGSGKAAGDSLTFTINATDALGRTAQSSSFTVTWKDCTPPEIISVVPSDLSPCPPANVTITAVITDNKAVASAILTFEGADHPMSGPSPSGEWTATIPGSGRSAGSSVEYSVTAFDAAGNSATSASYKATWRDCGAPEIESIGLSIDSPCGGEAVTIKARITDNIGVTSANISIDGVLFSMTGPAGPGDWLFTIAGKSTGQSVSCYITATDGEENTATSSTFTITWRDCIAPVTGSSPVLEPARPCAGEDVFVKVHITDNVGVTSATITYDGTSYQMSGPIGPENNGDWTATIIGAGKKAGDSINFNITATDAAGNAATPVAGSITWRDCIPPAVQSVDTSSSTPCAGTEVTITAHVTDDVGVDSADLYFDSTHHPMSGPVGSKEGYWTYTISGKTAGTSLNYTITASDGSSQSTPASGVILWKDCSNPDLNGPDIVSITPSPESPCSGTDVLVTAHLKDDNGVASAELVYDGTSQPMSGVAGSLDGYWTANIIGIGMLPGSSLSYTVRALDTLGNPTVSGKFTITWRDCSHPEISTIALSPQEPCAGDDVTVTVQITDNIGVVSATLTAGGTGYPMTGLTGSTSGEWTATIPGTGIPAGYVLAFSISATDATGNEATTADGQIHWIDCAIPEIQSVTPSNSQPCAGEDVTVTARILDDHGVASATLNFDSSSIPMSGPVGSISGDWTATIPGLSMQAGQTVTYSVTAKDKSGGTSVSESGTISWQDCTPPQISQISPGNIETCEGNGNLLIDARISATAGVVSARVIYEGEGEPGLYEAEMIRLGSDPKDSIWSGTISKRKVRIINYYITASTGKYTATSESHRAIFNECDEPELVNNAISTPCAGNDAQVSFTIRDEDEDFYRAAITYEGKEYPLHLLVPVTDQKVGTWLGSIPGFGQQPGETLTFSLNGYTLDTPGPNPPEGLGQFTVTWLDCRPGILSVTPGTTEVCVGNDQTIRARAASQFGISSVMLHFTDPTGQYETSMIIDQGADPKDASWTGLIPDQQYDGTAVEYYIIATSTNGDQSKMPPEGSYRLTWINCDQMEFNKTASPSIVAPGGTITYTITYRNRGISMKDVVITEHYPPGVTFLSASPPPDEGTDNRWTIGDLPAGASGTITIEVRAPDEAKIKFFMEQSAKGLGFVRTYKDMNTGREPKVLTNQVSMTAQGMAGQFAVSRVTISGEAGTKLSMRESGSGSYAREEELRYLRENRSIKDFSNLSASYQATKFLLPGNGSINYASKWTDREKARNYVTAESVEESYRYATKIQKESRIELDRNGTNMTTDSQFEGMRHAGYLKASKPDEKGHVFPLMEMSSDYAGSFRVKERLGTTYSNRSNAITTVKHYEMPHITIYQRSEIDNTDENNINYTISILNDGNRTLGPIYLMDLFPAGMSFFDASAHPSEEMLLDADHANWTFTSLPIGRSLTLYLRLMRYVVLETPVNWVFVKAGHDGTWLTANNSTISNFNWLSSMPTGKGEKMATGDWSPPDWGFDKSPDICKSCTYSPPP
ncbi:MAG TPA: PKD domain-containing protein [Methanothrix sp.]|nr:PKD domain-containing protein [Methanothrix sp.]